MRLFGFLSIFIFATLPAFAQDFEGLLSLPEGATMMNVSASERTEVEQDLLTATLRVQVENKDAAAVQNQINRAMRDALDEAKKVASVKAATLHYNVYQYDPNRGKDGLKADPIWRGEQSLQLKSKDAEALLELTKDLQKMGLMMNGLQFSVSSELRDETQSDLLEQALARLTAKAQRAGAALGKPDVELLSVNVGHSAPAYQPKMMMRSMAMESAMDMAAPVATPGQSEISLDVSATAILKP